MYSFDWIANARNDIYIIIYFFQPKFCIFSKYKMHKLGMYVPWVIQANLPGIKQP